MKYILTLATFLAITGPVHALDIREYNLTRRSLRPLGG